MNERRGRHHPGRRGGPFEREARDRRGSGRMRRGDVRSALLIALLDGPGHGYELIQALEAKTEGRWRPSPGSVYPSLQLLADEGLVVAREQDGKRVYELSDEGRAHAESHVADRGYPWDAMDRDAAGGGGLRSAMRDLHHAARQVGMTGSGDVVERATAIVIDARKQLYRLLAE